MQNHKCNNILFISIGCVDYAYFQGRNQNER